MYRINCSVAMLATLVSAQICAETVIPLKNQSSQVIQQDTSTCRSQADAQYPLKQSQQPTGGRVRGAATAASAGAVAAEVRGRQYDAYGRVNDDLQQNYRQNKAKSAAAAGAVIGAANQRKDRRSAVAATEQAAAANSSVYTACLQQRGYDVKP